MKVKDKEIKLLVEEIQKDFENRQKERKSFEAQWQLNNNFLIGNQYCFISLLNNVEDYDKKYFWQEREVFNHIAPIIDARLAKLVAIRPKMSVIPASSEENDIKVAKLSKDILESTYQKHNLSKVIAEGTKWSEICGTVFYKVIWKNYKGKTIAKNALGGDIKEGDLEIVAVPPYEIFPEANCYSSLDECGSIMHAKAYSVESVKSIWGVDVKPEKVDVFSLDKRETLGGLGYNASQSKFSSTIKQDHAIVIEKYEAPTVKYPNGRLITVCQDKLLYMGELPFINGIDGKRTYPFIRQVSVDVPGCFWGSSIIERIIPVQRAYNAIKNRKHEYLNRLSMGVLTVEDGSVDTDSLEEDGLCPGKVLVYRQGSNPPDILKSDSVPADFTKEEQRLLEEFNEISGVSDIFTDVSKITSNVSGVTLQLMLEQAESKLTSTIDNIKYAVKEIAKHILRLYKQFATTPRLLKLSNKGEVEVLYFNASDIGSEDIVFETENELGESLAQRRANIFEMLDKGLLYNSEGKISDYNKLKLLEMLGFGVWEDGVDIERLHIKHAESENMQFATNYNKVEVMEIDDHDLHIKTHIAYMLSNEYEEKLKKYPNLKDKILAHIRVHKTFLAMENKE